LYQELIAKGPGRESSGNTSFDIPLGEERKNKSGLGGGASGRNNKGGHECRNVSENNGKGNRPPERNGAITIGDPRTAKPREGRCRGDASKATSHSECPSKS